jgi:hypothetical protein
MPALSEGMMFIWRRISNADRGENAVSAGKLYTKTSAQQEARGDKILKQ